MANSIQNGTNSYSKIHRNQKSKKINTEVFIKIFKRSELTFHPEPIAWIGKCKIVIFVQWCSWQTQACQILPSQNPVDNELTIVDQFLDFNGERLHQTVAKASSLHNYNPEEFPTGQVFVYMNAL